MKISFKPVAAFMTAILFIMPLFSFSALGQSISTECADDELLTDLPASAVPVAAGELNIKAASALLMEPHTGRVLYEMNSKERLAPASITKIMSLLIIMEAIENGRLTLDSEVTAGEHSASMGGSQIWLEVGEVMTVDELLRASVIASANDATVALAEADSGSEEAFVKKMNQRAAELGMRDTCFKNACGLDEDGHYTTAHDVGIMASALIKHDLIKKYSTVWMDALRDGKSQLTNTNKLVRYYKGATGLKTGTTSKAGCSVAATAERQGLELVAVVMGSKNSNDRFEGAKKLLDYGFANWSFVTLTPNLKDLKPIELSGGMQPFFTAEWGGHTVELLLEKGKEEGLQSRVEINKKINAPVLTGDVIGKIVFTLEGKDVGELPLIASQSVERADFLNSLTALIYNLIRP